MTHVLTHVTNTNTEAVTTFDNYQFNSMTRFAGKYLAASDDGIVWLDDPASVEEITGTITTGMLHFGSDMQKRVSDFFIAMRSEGPITLRVSTDEVQSKFEYVINPLTISTMKQRRTLIGKGLKGKYWTFELACDYSFDYDTMSIMAFELSRRL